MRDAPHIVCFMPFAAWTLHSAREVTLLQALKLRGCTATTVLCDGVFSDCDMHQPFADGPQQRPAKACLTCQAKAAGVMADWGMPYRWLGRWLDDDDVRTAGAWVGSLQPEAYPEATYGDWQIGHWVRSSLHSHFRHNRLDLAVPRVAQAYASYMNSTLLACLGLSRLYDAEKPDVQIVVNGRMAVTRAALELARARGIRTLCEERSYVLERMSLFDNVNCLDNTRVNALWDAWRDVPLTAAEIDRLAEVLHRRWTGKSGEMVISPPITDTAALVRKLGLDPAKPLWALFTSCVDECVDDPSWHGVFRDQESWIESTLAYVAAHPELQLAIRVHPNTGSLRAIRTNPQELAYFSELAKRLPPNAVLIDSTSTVSSYGLAAAAGFGLIWYTTLGLEMACMGRPVLRAGGGWCPGKSFLQHADDPSRYSLLLDKLGSRPVATPADTIATWRFAYTFFWRQAHDFPLVAIPTWAEGRMAYTSLDALRPGQDPSLDRICDAIMNARPLAPVPENRDALEAATETSAILARIAWFAKTAAG